MISFSNRGENGFAWQDTVDDIISMADLDPRLWPVLRRLDTLLHAYRHHLVITSARREGGSGVHSTSPLRAVDARSHDLPKNECLKIENHLNERFPRDDGKPTCLYHSVTDYGDHFHVQIPYDALWMDDEPTDKAGSLE